MTGSVNGQARRLRNGAALAVLAWVGAGAAWAQDQAAQPQPEATTSVDEIVVTGSRIQRKDARTRSARS